MSDFLRHFIAISFSGLSTFVVAATQVQAQTTPLHLSENSVRSDRAMSAPERFPNSEAKAVNRLENILIAETDSNLSVGETSATESQEPVSRRIPMGCRIFPTASMQQ